MGSPGQNHHQFTTKTGDGVNPIQTTEWFPKVTPRSIYQQWEWMLDVQKQQIPTTGWYNYPYFLDEDSEIL